MEIQPRRVLPWLLGALLLSGCATATAERQTGRVTSDPVGATIYFSETHTGKKTPLGVTPSDVELNQGTWDVVLVAEKEGFETQSFLVPKTGAIDHHCVLERDLALQIADEAPRLPGGFKKGVALALGTFERALNSPKIFTSSVVSEGKTEIRNLAMDFPEQANSATMRALRRLSAAAEVVAGLDSSQYDTPVEQEAVLKVKAWIGKIRTGLGPET
jgi:PEGA domain